MTEASASVCLILATALMKGFESLIKVQFPRLTASGFKMTVQFVPPCWTNAAGFVFWEGTFFKGVLI